MPPKDTDTPESVDETPAPPPIVPPVEDDAPEEVPKSGDAGPAPEHDDAPEEAPTSDEIDQIIEDAVGVSFQSFLARHPSTARVLRGRLQNPTEFIIKALKEDELYAQLVADTEKTLSTAEIIKVIASIALRVAERFLVAV